MILLWNHSSMFHVFVVLRTLEMDTQYSSWGLSREEQSRMIFLDLLVTLLLMQPRMLLTSGLWMHTLASPTSTPGPSAQDCSQCVHPPHCTDAGHFPDTNGEPCTLDLMGFPWAHLLSLSRSFCMASSPSHMSSAPLSLVNSLRLHWVPLSMALIKILNSSYPWWTPFVTEALLDFELLTTTFCMRLSNQLIPPSANGWSLKSLPFQFREKCVEGDRVKGTSSFCLSQESHKWTKTTKLKFDYTGFTEISFQTSAHDFLPKKFIGGSRLPFSEFLQPLFQQSFEYTLRSCKSQNDMNLPIALFHITIFPEDF